MSTGPARPSRSTGTHVNIYVPTYRNEALFARCLDSYLGQSHEDLTVHIFDDGLAEGFPEIRDLVASRNDERIRYQANVPRLGAPDNDYAIIRGIDPTARAMVVPADMGLRADALETMLRASMEADVSVVRPGTATHDIASLHGDPDYAFTDPIRLNHPEHQPERRIFESVEIIAKYYGDANNRGEYFDFSFWGTLFDGLLVRNFDDGHLRFRFHGFEQYVSLQLLLSVPRVLLMPDTLLQGFVGQARLGGYSRPTDDMSRIECLVACEDFLSRNDFRLQQRGLSVEVLRAGQAAKAEYFLANFSGYRGYVTEILHRNAAFLAAQRGDATN